MNEIENLERLLSPDQQAIAKTIASLRVENRMLKARVESLTQEHQDLWKVMVVLLDHYKVNLDTPQLRIHESQFKRFDESYRIQRTVEEAEDGGKEVVLELLYVTDTAKA
jgi:hypothetical protein